MPPRRRTRAQCVIIWSGGRGPRFHSRDALVQGSGRLLRGDPPPGRPRRLTRCNMSGATPHPGVPKQGHGPVAPAEDGRTGIARAKKTFWPRLPARLMSTGAARLSSRALRQTQSGRLLFLKKHAFMVHDFPEEADLLVVAPQ